MKAVTGWLLVATACVMAIPAIVGMVDAWSYTMGAPQVLDWTDERRLSALIFGIAAVLIGAMASRFLDE